VADAQTRLPELMARAAAADEVRITREDGTGVRLAPVGASLRPRFGSARGMFSMTDDFDAPLEAFRPYER
jgi:antitoxin (DNA-binding transcriptional repressor) of toxin-antitoxin stability system